MQRCLLLLPGWLVVAHCPYLIVRKSRRRKFHEFNQDQRFVLKILQFIQNISLVLLGENILQIWPNRKIMNFQLAKFSHYVCAVAREVLLHVWLQAKHSPCVTRLCECVCVCVCVCVQV